MPLHRTGGFSLIETTIAVGIIGVMVVAAGALLQRIPIDGREVRDQDLALKIARHEIEVLRGAGYDALPVSGSFTNPLLGSLSGGMGSVTVATYNAKTKRADIGVSWVGTGSVARSLTLTTLITQDSGL